MTMQEGRGNDGLCGIVPSWHVTLSAFLRHVTALKKCHVPLISQTNVRPVTPEIVGSSPVAPAKDFNGLSGGRFFTSNF
jgi:hypothetical protein